MKKPAIYRYPSLCQRKLMQVIFSFCFISFASSFYGQSNSLIKINTTTAEAYFTLADIIQAGKEPTITEWQSLFGSIIYQGMIGAKVLDTAIFKAEMRRVYSPSTLSITSGSFTEKEQYHKAYKENEEKLKKYISALKSSHVVDSVKTLLHTMLPKRLQTENLFPVLHYLNYETDEATGGPNMVINDLLLSYKIDSYKFGLLAAHEGFHAIVSAAFEQALKSSINDNAPDYNVLFFIENISEEGIADLIDKPLLTRKDSPMYSEFMKLEKNDEQLAPIYIQKFDSLVSQLPVSSNPLPELINYSENGGHIPGRFMGKAIQKAGLVQKHLIKVEDPVSFFMNYNAAAKKLGKGYPLFSTQCIKYL